MTAAPVTHVLYLDERPGRSLLSGAENHLWILLPAMARAGVDVELLLGLWRGKPSAQLQRKVDELRSSGVRVSVVDGGLKSGGRSRLGVARTLYGVRQVLRHRRDRTIHIHLELKYTPLLARSAGCKQIVATIHNDSPALESISKTWFKAVHRVVREYIAISDRVRSFFLEVAGAPEHRVTTVYYGVQAPTTSAKSRGELGLPDDRFIVGFVGRLVPQKNLFALLDAVHGLPDVLLVLVGAGPLEAELRARAEASSTSNVRFFGAVPDAERLMPAFDVLCLPSSWEGLGLVLIEAMLRRLPIIGSTRGAIPDILANGDCGILCETNADDIRAAIERCRADRPGLARLAARAYDYARTRFAVDSMLSQTLAVYARTR